MNKSTKYMFIIGLFLIEVTSLFLTFKSYANKTIDEIENKNIVDDKTFAMYIENDSGEYDELLDSTLFPPDTHELNYELTKCVDNKGNSVNSSILAYSNGKVTATSNKTVFCYLYFEYLPKAYAIYSADDNSLRFYQNTNYETLGDTYNGLAVTEIYTDFLSGSSPWRDSSYKTTITNVVVEEEIQPTNTSKWFEGMTNVFSLDLNKLIVSKVENMSGMFWDTGISSSLFEIIGLDNWDTSNVTNMSSMFIWTGKNATEWNIGDISKWNTSKVTHMNGMFNSAGQNASIWNIGDLSTKVVTKEDGMTYIAWDTSNVVYMQEFFANTGNKVSVYDISYLSTWDTSRVINMNKMFYNSGINASIWNIGDLQNWDVSNVTNMSLMFDSAGSYSSTFELSGLNYWDTSKVTNMSSMFRSIAKNVQTFKLDLSEWDTSSVTNMSGMFWDTGLSSSLFEIIGLDNWDTSNVTNMSGMFIWTGRGAAEWSIGDLSNWNTSQVINMSEMFDSAGYNASEWSIGDISLWDTSNVTNMFEMFSDAGKTATYLLDLSNWKVPLVTNYNGFNTSVESKIISPTWVN